MILKWNIKGISLPLVVGLVSMLMIASVAANSLIIRTMRSVHRIEASDKAYFAAEAGIEDALYELAPHFAGYETGIRTGDLRVNTTDIDWRNEWTIESKDTNSDTMTGRFYSGQKLIISLFNDTSGTASVASNAINTDAPVISTLNPSANFTITFAVPASTLASAPTAFIGGLFIDNDGDLGNSDEAGEEGVIGLNEDRSNQTGSCILSGQGSGTVTKDHDCDGRENEDSPEDVVILWKISDGLARSLTPIKGCLGKTETGFDVGTEICEKNFVPINCQISLSNATEGISESGDTSAPESIGAFIQRVISNPVNNQKLQMEFLIVAPLEQVDINQSPPSKIPIPYLAYTIDTPGVSDIPSPYFTIESDGWYKDFKQSITTIITPKTAVPLFDFTIIQQQ